MFVNATTLDPCCCCCCCRLIARWKWLFQLPSSRLASNALDCNLRALWRRAVMCRAFSELYRQHQMTKSSSEFTLRRHCWILYGLLRGINPIYIVTVFLDRILFLHSRYTFCCHFYDSVHCHPYRAYAKFIRHASCCPNRTMAQILKTS